MNSIRRMRPWLGTLVEIRVEGLVDDAAHAAIDRAYAEIATIHRLMSFHDTDSDVSRLNLATAPLPVDARTFEVLQAALRIAETSRGLFDPTIAPAQVAGGALPRPVGPWPDASANWRHIELLDDCTVRFRRPMWIDLGGIAKGYAVDRAMAVLVDAGATQVCVNAGGDLRVHGARCESIHIRTADGITREPIVELSNAALATSTAGLGSHVHGVTREPIEARRTVSVVANDCLIADALTKVVLAGDVRITRIVLDAFDAQASVCDARSGWHTMEHAA